ncbi:hypothetical protein PSEUBRA_003360 [Kalmanozyma brasiliensis GHG001]|uniref:uncharacterized protein n=1 Tax=Kalmanozyma brasiliensis (strain GHG001) TaxID=1365824 RepID=UPI002867DADB|nr:uncharacterized protein PSEUBRA_003360 [Kalmanozyma brasiliensis GHG001]KAF6767228.1 hypothetical protein PSEUBRA_003360 [Kalmanozyma brasiliensis GHG001]
MSATTQQDAGAPSAPSLSQQPPSSPIDGFGSPSLLTLPPPVDRSIRSQSSSAPPRLHLASSGGMNQSRSARSSSLLPRPSAPELEEEVDELDEFDAQPSIDLDSDEFERLEADSLRMATQQPHRKAVPAVDPVNSSNALVIHPQASQKRSFSSAIDRRETLAESSMQSHKRAKVGQPADAATAIKPFKPFFEEEWVKELLSESEGPRAPSPAEPSFTSGLCKLSGSQEEPIVIHDTYVPSPATQPANQPATQPAFLPAFQPATQPATRKPCKSSARPCAVSAASRTHARKRASFNNDHSSSDDDDVPLASLGALNGAAGDPAPILAAISKVENAVAELKKAYENEVDGMKVKLFEREILIDKLRAQQRKKPSK